MWASSWRSAVSPGYAVVVVASRRAGVDETVEDLGRNAVERVGATRVERDVEATGLRIIGNGADRG